jgi:hypothetical protein
LSVVILSPPAATAAYFHWIHYSFFIHNIVA